MFTSTEIRINYHAQGYNDLERAPDGRTILWGGCQASALLFILRSFTKNPNLSMLDIAKMAEKCDVEFFDPKYATKISYPAVYRIANIALPNHRVELYHTATYEEIRDQEPTNYFGREARKVYLDMYEERKTHYGADIASQSASISKTLSNGGAAIPLLDANTLYSNKET